jgi:hypothetical protein
LYYIFSQYLNFMVVAAAEVAVVVVVVVVVVFNKNFTVV